MNLVSIIIPAFNEQRNIERLLKSIKKQSYRSIETIVVDDGSSDATVEVSKRFTSKVYKEKHAERSAQRNFGASKARGNYLLFLDADMELTKNVIKDCVEVAESHDFRAIVIPERTVGKEFVQNVRKFEREMYEGDPTIELARFFERKVFFEFGGYDLKLTGPEDYDLPYRIGEKYKIGRSKEYILHHEEKLTLGKLLKKKFYYASRGALYAQKHPELIPIQGTIIFRKAYLRHWKKFLNDPFIGLAFICVRLLETVWAITGYISAVGFINFVKTLPKLFK